MKDGEDGNGCEEDAERGRDGVVAVERRERVKRRMRSRPESVSVAKLLSLSVPAASSL